MDVATPPDAVAREEILRRAYLTTWLSGALAGVVGFATAFRPFVSDVGTVFTWIGAANSAILLLLWWLFRSGHIVRRAPEVLLVFVTLVAIPIIVISGGPNSQFAPLLPLFPICGVMLGGKRAAVAIFAFWAVALPLLHLLGPVIPDLTGELHDPAKSASRALWLVLASLVGLIFGLHFDRTTRRLQEQLQEMVERDPLTGVANRRGLEIAMAQVMSAASRSGDWVTFMVLDLDHFKEFNDRKGHAEGDRALQAVARALEGECRRGTDRVARIGGEEFVVILADTDRDGAQAMAGKLLAAVRSLGIPHPREDGRPLTATIGYTSVPGFTAPGADELFRAADAALYEGKRRGRNQAVEARELAVAGDGVLAGDLPPEPGA